jgi:hypothetical protein
MITSRVFGSTASGLANLLLFGSVAALWPRIPDYCLCVAADPGVITVVDTWRPFIDNTGGGFLDGSLEPQCPALGDDRFNLIAAPLPDGFDPHGYGGGALYACVLVGREGAVLDARMLRGTGRAGLDRLILGSIRRDWRFRPVLPEAKRSWQRVPLNPGPVNGVIWDPPILY